MQQNIKEGVFVTWAQGFFISKRSVSCDLVESNAPVTGNTEKLINSK